MNCDLGWDTAKVNVDSVAIAIGHPIGASGARVLIISPHAMARSDVRKGRTTVYVGGGMGVAMYLGR